jgi:eukaryotic-like serine/threonine-protein kinase
MVRRATDELRLEELLIVWEEVRERGEPMTVEQLCRDCPELAEELGRRIQALRDWDVLTPGSSARSSGSSETVSPSPDCAPASACVTLQLGSLQFHERGGLGTIFKARHKGLPRDVALKFIRRDHAGDPQCSKRFLREAEITARLEHPGITPIYGMGRDETGNPCYAMRFVEGTTLERAIEQYHARLDLGLGRVPMGRDREFRALLRRFKSACTTIGYAHSRGVLHRDIKPANIMLGPFDETLVLDWGLGKIIAIEDAGSVGEPGREAVLPSPGTDELETWGVIGTPGFMSPEQHAGLWGKVGRAGDIYGLGATLYVLLTGRTPFEGRGPGEISAKVGRGEFTPPRQVRPEISRPLEAICLKAMALAPEDRYRSAIDLAGDLENWITDEPVRAWTEPWTDRARRWTSRHRTLVTTGAVATLLVLIGLIAILVQQGRSNRHLAIRNEELRQARARAEGRVELALNAIDQFRVAVADNPQLKHRPELAQLRQGLLRAPQEFYRQIRRDIEETQDPSPEALAALAKVVLGLAQITGEIDSRQNAIRAYQEGIGVLDRLLSGRPDDPTLRALQAAALLQLARLLREVGELPEAETNNDRAREILERLLRQRPEDANLRKDLGKAYDELGMTRFRADRFEEAVVFFERARGILEAPEREEAGDTRHRSQLALVYNHLGMVRRKTGSLDQALAFYEHALKLQERLARERPNDPWTRAALAVLHFNIGNLRRQTSGGGVVASYERANEIFEGLVQEYRSISEFRMNYARCLGNLAMLTTGTETRLRAIPAFIRVAELQREEVELHPGVVSFRLDLALTLFHLARSYIIIDQPQDALRYSEEGTERLDALLASDKDPPSQARSLLGLILEKRAEALAAMGRVDEAVEALRAAVRHQGRALEQDPASGDYRQQLFDHHCRLAALRLILGQVDEAVASLGAMQPLWAANPGDLFENAQDLARSWSRASDARVSRTERTGKAAELYGGLVVTILERSVDAGFRDVSRLMSDPAFEPFRTRDDFERLLTHAMDLGFPSNPFGAR